MKKLPFPVTPWTTWAAKHMSGLPDMAITAILAGIVVFTLYIIFAADPATKLLWAAFLLAP